MSPLDWAELIGKQGMSVVSAGVVIWAVIWSMHRSARLTDTLLKQILHGDGNGSPSLKKLDERIDRVEDTQRVATEQMAELRADVGRVADAWAQCRKTPGCPIESE